RESAVSNISSETQAQAMADAAKNHLANLTQTTQPVVLPWHPGVEMFDVIRLRNPQVRSGAENCLARRITERLDPANPELSIEGTGTVSLFVDRWIAKEVLRGNIQGQRQAAEDTR